MGTTLNCFVRERHLGGCLAGVEEGKKLEDKTSIKKNRAVKLSKKSGKRREKTSTQCFLGEA